MNDKDESRFTPKLSLTPLVEDLEAKHQTETPMRGLKMICPKCGYRAKSSDDPLLTKFNGLGECPSCGIIPQKYLEKREKKNSANSADNSLAGKNSVNRKHNVPISKVVVLSGIFAVLVPLVFLLKSPDTDTKVVLDSPTTNEKARMSASQSQMSASQPQNLIADRSDQYHAFPKLTEIKNSYWNKIKGHNDFDSKITAAEMTASEIASAKHGLTDPKTIAAYDRCYDSFQKYASNLRSAKTSYETIKIIDNNISYIRKRAEEEISKLRSRGDGPLIYNAIQNIDGAAYVQIRNLESNKYEIKKKSLAGPGNMVNNDCDRANY